MGSMLLRPLDWPAYILKVLPIWIRSRPHFSDWTQLMFAAFKQLNEDLVSYRLSLLSEYQGSGQCIVLERILRDRCAGGAAKIWVVNGVDVREEYELYKRNRPGAPIYGYSRTEVLPAAQGYIYLRPEQYADGAPDFTIEVTTAHWASMSNQQRQLLIRLIERFKIYGSTYQIIQI
jgi:hypothetical protein